MEQNRANLPIGTIDLINELTDRYDLYFIEPIRHILWDILMYQKYADTQVAFLLRHNANGKSRACLVEGSSYRPLIEIEFFKKNVPDNDYMMFLVNGLNKDVLGLTNKQASEIINPPPAVSSIKHGFFDCADPAYGVCEGYASDTHFWNGWCMVHLPKKEAEEYVKKYNASYEKSGQGFRMYFKEDGTLVSVEEDGEETEIFLQPIETEDGVVSAYDLGASLGWCWETCATHEWVKDSFSCKEDIIRWFRALHFLDGLNFHPDNPMTDYVWGDRSPNEVETLQELLDHCFDICEREGWDIHELGLIAMCQFRHYCGADMMIGLDPDLTDTSDWLQPRTEESEPEQDEFAETNAKGVLAFIMEGDMGKAREYPLTQSEVFWPKDLPFKHTPGPWAITIFNNKEIHEPSTISIETRDSCHVTEYIVCILRYQSDREQARAEADAALIKRAPQMLDLLLKSREEMLLMAKATGCDLPVWRKRCIEPIDDVIKSLL